MQPWKLEPAHDHGLPWREGFRSLERENGLVATGLHFVWWSLVRIYLAVWHRLRIEGREHVPSRGPFVMIANHASHLDALVLAAALPWHLHGRVYPIAAGDVFFHSPGRSALSAMFLNALPLWRKKVAGHALQTLRQRLLEEECCYVLFPEGARSRDGAMLPFKTGLGMIVAGAEVPVLPCYLAGCYQACPPGKVLPRPRSIQLRIGPAMRFADVSDDRTGWEQIAGRLEHAVRELASR